MKAMEPYLGSGEVMERYRISTRTLHRWMKNQALGFPKPFRINRRFYFKVADLDRWEASRGAVSEKQVETVKGLPIVSDVIQDYAGFVKAMVARRRELGLSCMELDLRAGMQESYANKLENWPKAYGRGIGPEIFPLWLGGLKVGIILVDLPRRPRKRRTLDASVAA
ncbi:helix-turn-helix transcriptional regulator [Rhizobium mongolense]